MTSGERALFEPCSPLPMTTAVYNETNAFAIKFIGAKGEGSYILGHQPSTIYKELSFRCGRADMKLCEEAGAAASP